MGVTMVVSMKMHVKDLYKDIFSKVKLVQEGSNDTDTADKIRPDRMNNLIVSTKRERKKRNTF